jgi:hypothetical protein
MPFYCQRLVEDEPDSAELPIEEAGLLFVRVDADFDSAADRSSAPASEYPCRRLASVIDRLEAVLADNFFIPRVTLVGNEVAALLRTFFADVGMVRYFDGRDREFIFAAVVVNQSQIPDFPKFVAVIGWRKIVAVGNRIVSLPIVLRPPSYSAIPMQQGDNICHLRRGRVSHGFCRSVPITKFAMISKRAFLPVPKGRGFCACFAECHQGRLIQNGAVGPKPDCAAAI